MDFLKDIDTLFAKSSLECLRTEEVVKNVLALMTGALSARSISAPNSPPLFDHNSPRQKKLTLQREQIGFWLNAHHGAIPGVYSKVGIPHPCQDPSFPFVYLPHTDEYVGFRWDYGDVGPMVPPLTADVLHKLPGLFLSPGPSEYFAAHGAGWDSRFTVVLFKLPQTYYSLQDSLGASKLLHAPNYDHNRETSGEYFATALHPNAKSFQDVGYEALYTHEANGILPELFIFNPGLQITRTVWYEWKAVP